MIEIIHGDCREMLRTLEAESVQTCVTSPPYWGLRDYGVCGQLGLEKTADEYVQGMVEVFREVRRVLKADGTLWLNLGDSYGRGKQLMGIPWRVAFALQADGWILRSDIIWAKPNPMPESVTDRPTKAHEYVFLFAKSERYFYDVDAVREPHCEEVQRAIAKHLENKPKHEDAGQKTNLVPGKSKQGNLCRGGNNNAYAHPLGRNRRTVWTLAPGRFKGAHFATFPPALVEPCIKAGSRPGDTVLDPFNGAGTTGLVAKGLGRNYVGIELNAEYVEMTRRRLDVAPGLGRTPEQPPKSHQLSMFELEGGA